MRQAEAVTSTETGAGSPHGPRLRPPEHRVSGKAIVWWTLRCAFGWVIVIAPLLAGRWLWPDPPIPLGTAAAIAGGIAVLHVAVMPTWRYRVHRWELSEHAVYTQSGWLNQEWRVAPASRIQTVDTERGPLQQLLGLSTVTVTTASAAGPLQITGLDRDTGIRIVEELTATTEANPGDAT
ncbi:Bacterial membrane flanked domain protein [Actinoalloteichus hoggarensis]|uniref:Bacterial membrane flanked domain protein n=1 Tax=Actinoalloteichus hoggarensis TaxID=1470176 RepID=A0A221VZJ3_9PSEU|nr:PH domain-containing protein [Actinoalloteichus hoggarensis]ASO18940.1 Bacterial membrane flanked domain protein [Actinoalloteichus hoggarensis]